MIIFHFAVLPHNPSFASGLMIDPPAVIRPADPVTELVIRTPKPVGYSVEDAAWQAGFTAASEDGWDACPPSGLTPCELRAWHRGASAAFLDDEPMDCYDDDVVGYGQENLDLGLLRV